MVEQQEGEKANGGKKNREDAKKFSTTRNEKCDLARTIVERLIQFEVYSDGHRAATFQ